MSMRFDTADSILERMQEAENMYYRLVILVAPSGAGKTHLLQEVGERLGGTVTNLNRELSQRLLEFSKHRRALQVEQLTEDVVSANGEGTVILDNIEILFDRSLQQHPLRLLKNMARRRTVIASWNGLCENDTLTYAIPGHPERQSYPVEDFLVASPAAFSENVEDGNT